MDGMAKKRKAGGSPIHALMEPETDVLLAHNSGTSFKVDGACVGL